MLAHLLLGRDARVVGMLLAIPPLDRGGGGVFEDRDRVARLEVTPEYPLPDDQRFIVRTVVVGNVDLVKAAAETCQLQRGGAYLHPPVLASHPEARVARGDEELRPRGGHALRSTGHEREDEERHEARHAPPI